MIIKGVFTDNLMGTYLAEIKQPAQARGMAGTTAKGKNTLLNPNQEKYPSKSISITSLECWPGAVHIKPSKTPLIPAFQPFKGVLRNPGQDTQIQEFPRGNGTC